MKFAIILTFFSIFAPVMADECASYIGSCDYYLCREKIHACGDKGYYMDFAYKYCKDSEVSLNKTLTNEGQGWSQKVAVCLQKSVETIPYNTSCTEVKRIAIRDHGHCYIDTGFCELTKKDQASVLWLVKSEARYPQILKQGLSIMSECGGSEEQIINQYNY